MTGRKARAAGLGTARCLRSGIAGCLTRMKARAATAGALYWLSSFHDPKLTNTHSGQPGLSDAAHSFRCVDLICPVPVGLVKHHENCWAPRYLARCSTDVPWCAARLLKVLRRATCPPMAAAARCLVKPCPGAPEVASFLDATLEPPMVAKRSNGSCSPHSSANCFPLPASFRRGSRSHFHDPQNLQRLAALARDAKQCQTAASPSDCRVPWRDVRRCRSGAAHLVRCPWACSALLCSAPGFVQHFVLNPGLTLPARRYETHPGCSQATRCG